MKSASYRRGPQRSQPPSRERGTVLVVALVFLVIMTLLGIGAMRTSVLEERMAGNLREDRVSFEAAEAALRAGESLLLDSAGDIDFGTDTGFFHHADDNAPDPLSFGSGESVPFTYSLNGTDPSPLNGVASQPIYFIEKLPAVTPPGNSLEGGTPVTGKALFRIVARGRGGSEESETVLQSTYMR